MKNNFDIDIDFGDRSKLLEYIKHIPAAMRNVTPIKKHNTGVYVTEVPYDPLNDMANIDYTEAEDRGYIKLDLLNVHVYNEIKTEQELIELMREPNWSLLNKKEFVEQLVHLGNHYYNLQKMSEPVDSIPRLAMFLACIRPAKKHLIGKSWSEVAEAVWEKTIDGYSFKKSHSVAYAQLVVVHMNYLENLNHSAN
jgi:hypothetical protein